MAGAGRQGNWGGGVPLGACRAVSQGATASPAQGGGTHAHASPACICNCHTSHGFLPSWILHKRHKKIEAEPSSLVSAIPTSRMSCALVCPPSDAGPHQAAQQAGKVFPLEEQDPRDTCRGTRSYEMPTRLPKPC